MCTCVRNSKVIVFVKINTFSSTIECVVYGHSTATSQYLEPNTGTTFFGSFCGIPSGVLVGARVLCSGPWGCMYVGEKTLIISCVPICAARACFSVWGRVRGLSPRVFPVWGNCVCAAKGRACAYPHRFECLFCDRKIEEGPIDRRVCESDRYLRFLGHPHHSPVAIPLVPVWNIVLRCVGVCLHAVACYFCVGVRDTGLSDKGGPRYEGWLHFCWAPHRFS